MIRMIKVDYFDDVLLIVFKLNGKQILKGIYVFRTETFKVSKMSDKCCEVYKEIVDALIKEGFFENKFQINCKNEIFKQKIKEYERERFERAKARSKLALAGDYPGLFGKVPQLTLWPGTDKSEYT